MYKKREKNEVDEKELVNDLLENEDSIKLQTTELIVEEIEITSDNGYIFIDKTNLANKDIVQSDEEERNEGELENPEKTLQNNKKFFETFFNHFNSVFRSKNGKKLIILLICVVLFISFVLIYGVATKYSVGSVFKSDVNCFVKNIVGDSGRGEIVSLKISDLEREKQNKKLFYNYQYIEFNGKDLNKDKKLGTLNFSIAAKLDVTINVALVIKKNDSEILQRFTYVAAKKGTSVQCKLSVQNKIDDFNAGVKMILTFSREFDANINIFNMYWTTY